MPRVYFQSCGTALFLRLTYGDVNFMRLVVLFRFGCIDHLRYQMFERLLRIAAPAGVNGRSLNDGAAWCDEPVKTLALW